MRIVFEFFCNQVSRRTNKQVGFLQVTNGQTCENVKILGGGGEGGQRALLKYADVFLPCEIPRKKENNSNNIKFCWGGGDWWWISVHIIILLCLLGLVNPF